MTRSTGGRVVLIVLLALVAALAAGLLFSAKLRHQARRVMTKTEMTIAGWRGHPAQLVSLAGRVAVAGAQIQALDSRSGWAALADKDGRFTLLDVMWYRGASYDLVMSTDGETGRMISLTPSPPPEDNLIHLGDLSFDEGKAVVLRDLPGLSGLSVTDYDSANGAFYRDLYAQLTAGKQTDEAIVGAVNDYVATKLNYDETQWELGSPRRVLETGSQYCGHLSAAMAALLANSPYPLRQINLTDGRTPPGTHVVVEVFYGGAWHLYDPTYGTVYRSRDGAVMSYEQLRLDPSAIKEELFTRLTPKQRRATVALLLGIFSTGEHRFYIYKERP
ncbi:MAG: transglutaminase domain-containing protein [Blastocatellia bacterium]